MHMTKPSAKDALRMARRWVTANRFFTHIGLILDFMVSSSVRFCVEILLAKEGKGKVAEQREC